MADRKISIELRAKNAMRAGISRAKKALLSFGKATKAVALGIGKAFKRGAVGVLALGASFLVAAKKAEEFNIQVAQIATLTDLPIRTVKKNIQGLSAEFGLAKDALTKGLYDALSAGVPKDNAFEFLRVASKTARAGATDTAQAVDLLTTAMNSYKVPAKDAQKVSDLLFTTVRLGKTTIGELAQSLASVAPLAAASGVAMDDLLSSVATLTKQGTPTAQAMTQIRGAIIAMNRELGDGWSATMTLQEGMEAMREKAGGSNKVLKELVGRIEGVNAILGVTGENAKGAADDIDQMAESIGAADAAFAKVDKSNPLQKMQQSLHNLVLLAGDEVLQAFGPMITRIAEEAQKLAANGSIAQWAGDAADAFKRFIAVMQKFVDARFEIAAKAITAAIVFFSIKILIATKNMKLLSLQMNKTAIAAAAQAVALRLSGGAVSILTAKVIALKVALFGATAAVAALAAVAVTKLLKTIFEVNEATAQFDKTLNNLAADAASSRSKFGAIPSVLKQIREAMEAGDTSTLEKLARIYPDVAKKINAMRDALVAQKKAAEEAAKPTGKILGAKQVAPDKTKHTKAEISEIAAHTKKVNNDIAKAGKAADDERLQRAGEIKDKIKALAQEEKDARLAAQNEVVKKAKDNAKELQKIAKQRVGEIIAEAKAGKAEEKKAAGEAKRAAELRGRVARGTKLDPKSKAFLAAFDKIEKAKKDLPAAKAKLAAEQAKLDKIQGDQLRALLDIKEDQAATNKALQKLLAMG